MAAGDNPRGAPTSRTRSRGEPRGGERLRTALYVGGLLGPFGGGLVVAILPELSQSFDASVQAVGASLTAYMVPFATLLLVSGTLGERWGRRRTVRIAYTAYVLASLACAAAPALEPFLLGRAAQGAANAFTTPLLLAGLVETAPAGQAGRAVGVYASFQAAGQTLSPLAAGSLAEIDWRLAFVGVAIVAGLLALVPPPGEPRRHASAPPIRPLLNPRMGLLALAAAGASLSSLSIAFLTALRARDAFGLSPAGTGAVLLCFGLAGLLFARSWGRVTDLVGARNAGVAAALAASATVVSLGRVEELWLLVVTWTLTGLAASLLTVAIQALAADATPTNRGGGVSVTLAFRFGGFAIAPALWLPLADARGLEAAFTGAAIVGLVVAGLLAPLGPRSGGHGLPTGATAETISPRGGTG